MLLQSASGKLERDVRQWVDTMLNTTYAMEERNNGRPIEARAKQTLSAAGSLITKDWEVEQCTGRAAVLVMRSLIASNGQALGVAYGLQNSEHFKLQRESAIEGLIADCIEAAGASKVQLAVMFEVLKTQQGTLAGIADAEHKSLKHDREQDAQRADNMELLSKLVAQQGPTPRQQQLRAVPVQRLA